MGKNDFYDGVCAALSVISLHDNPVIYKEILNTCGWEKVFTAAKKSGSIKITGLNHYDLKTKSEKIKCT